MKPSEALAAHHEEVIALLDRYGFSNVRVFGSVAAGRDTAGSDLDLLVTVPTHLGFEYFDFLDELEAILGIDVDVLDDVTHGMVADDARRSAVPLGEVMAA